jgi:hypothetical protein
MSIKQFRLSSQAREQRRTVGEEGYFWNEPV